MKKARLLKRLMQQYDMTQRDVAELIRCDRSLVSKAANGEKENCEWFWESLSFVTSDEELGRILMDEKIEELQEFQAKFFSSKNEKAPGKEPSAEVAI